MGGNHERSQSAHKYKYEQESPAHRHDRQCLSLTRQDNQLGMRLPACTDDGRPSEAAAVIRA